MKVLVIPDVHLKPQMFRQAADLMAPTCTVNDEVHPNMTPEKVVGLITELRGEC